eukprot:11039.XXX_529292_529608_1 [CDS] Oithona nana genome sequencing.
MKQFSFFCLCLILVAAVIDGFRITQVQDSYPWESCNAFEATKKNCPRGEACLKLKNFSYAWNWAMRCQSREEYITRFEYQSGSRKK